MRIRKSTWLNAKTMKPMYGIQVSVEPRKWLNASEDGRPLIFESETERDTKIREMERSK